MQDCRKGIFMVLSALKTGRRAICLPPGGNTLVQRLLNMGFADGMAIERLYENPGNTLTAFRIQDSIIALRRGDLEKIHTKTPAR